MSGVKNLPRWDLWRCSQAAWDKNGKRETGDSAVYSHPKSSSSELALVTCVYWSSNLRFHNVCSVLAGSSSIRLPLWGSVCNGPLEVREAVPALLQRCSTDVVEHDETAMGRAKWRWGARLCVFFLFKTCLCGSHRDVDCLMLWKLTREGDVGIDMAWVIRARMECCSCHRWKRFLTAERTCHTGGQTVHRQSLPISGHTSKERFRNAKAPVMAFRCAEV